MEQLLKFAPVIACFIQTLTFLTTISTFIVLYRQLHTAVNNVRLSTMMQRRDMYIGLTNTLPEKDVEAMLLHPADHFDGDVYLNRYRGHPDRIKSYFLMKRKYLYLLLTTHLNTQYWDPAREAPKIWLEELCQYQEFRDVHASQRHYYPGFAEKVDQVLRLTTLKGWALDQPITRGQREGTQENADYPHTNTSFLAEGATAG